MNNLFSSNGQTSCAAIPVNQKSKKHIGEKQSSKKQSSKKQSKGENLVRLKEIVKESSFLQNYFEDDDISIEKIEESQILSSNVNIIIDFYERNYKIDSHLTILRSAEYLCMDKLRDEVLLLIYLNKIPLVNVSPDIEMIYEKFLEESKEKEMYFLRVYPDVPIRLLHTVSINSVRLLKLFKECNIHIHELIVLCSSCVALESLKYLIQLNNGNMIPDEVLNNSINEASYCCDLNFIKYLMHLGAKPTFKSLQNAIKQDNIEIVKFLFEKDIDTAADSIIEAQFMRSFDSFKYLFEKTDKSDIQKILEVSIFNYNIEEVKYLLENGANIGEKEIRYIISASDRYTFTHFSRTNHQNYYLVLLKYLYERDKNIIIRGINFILLNKFHVIESFRCIGIEYFIKYLELPDIRCEFNENSIKELLNYTQKSK